MNQLQAKIFRRLYNLFRVPATIAECLFAKDAGRKWRADFFFHFQETKATLEVEADFAREHRNFKSRDQTKFLQISILNNIKNYGTNSHH
ncbi:MAG: hypothetical protein R2828_29435 [Saprospiraceae bacterium]